MGPRVRDWRSIFSEPDERFAAESECENARAKCRRKGTRSVERVSRASASPATLVRQEIVKKDTQRVVARLRPAILGPIFIIVYEQLNSRQLPCTRRFSIRQPVAARDTRAFVPIPSFLLNHQWNSDHCRLSCSHVSIRII